MSLEKPASLGPGQRTRKRENRPGADFRRADRTDNPVVMLCPLRLEEDLVPKDRTNVRRQPVRGKKLIHKTGLFPVKSINQMFCTQERSRGLHVRTPGLTREKRCG